MNDFPGPPRHRSDRGHQETATYRPADFESGVGGVTVEEVSRRSGVAKTTIYRHWPSRSALLLDACSKIGTAFEVPDTGSFSADVRALTEALAGELRTARWPSLLPSIVDAAERNSGLARLQAALQEKLMGPFTEVIERARGRGEIAADRPAAEVIAAIVGPLY